MKKVFLGAVLSILVIPFVSCNSSSTATERTMVTNDGNNSLIKHIDADFMKKNIYDWEEHPGEFVYKGSRPAIIDFFATWCGPCRRLSPKLEEIAKKYQGKIDVYKVDVDDEMALAKLFGVKSIPMCLFIPLKGTPTQTQGDLSEAQIEENVKNILNK